MSDIIFRYVWSFCLIYEYFSTSSSQNSATIIDFLLLFVRPGSIIAEFSVTFSGEEEIDPVLLDQDINAFAQNLPEEFSIDPEFTSHEGK